MKLKFVNALSTRLLTAGFSLALLVAGAQAGTLNLTTGGVDPVDSGWLGGAFFVNTEPAGSQGSGVLQPFLRLQGKKNTPGDEQGYNTDGSTEFDTKGGVHTHSVEFGDIVPFDCAVFSSDCSGKESNSYYLFALDYNESANSPLIDLTKIEIYAADDNKVKNYGPPTDPWDQKLFDLDSSEDNTVNLDYATFGTGSGGGDLFVYIPLPTIPDGYPYMVFFSAFGGATDGDDDAGFDAGFEEWAFKSNTDLCTENCGGGNVGEVPEPSTVLLLGGSLLALSYFRKKRNS